MRSWGGKAGGEQPSVLGEQERTNRQAPCTAPPATAGRLDVSLSVRSLHGRFPQGSLRDQKGVCELSKEETVGAFPRGWLRGKKK